MANISVEGKVAVVTGAGSGLGMAVTKLFLAEGARVVAADIAPDRLAQYEGTAGVVACLADVARQSDVDRMIQAAVDSYGKLDILVNNAGVLDRFLAVGEMTDDVWQRVLGININGPFYACRRAIPLMVENGGGVIVNISSLAGLRGVGGAAYVTSKHAIIGLTRNIAVTYGDKGIRCVAVCPGAVKTAIAQSHGSEVLGIGQQAHQRVVPSRPRVADPIEVANVVFFVASGAASYVNGTVIVADGGWRAF